MEHHISLICNKCCARSPLIVFVNTHQFTPSQLISMTSILRTYKIYFSLCDKIDEQDNINWLIKVDDEIAKLSRCATIHEESSTTSENNYINTTTIISSNAAAASLDDGENNNNNKNNNKNNITNTNNTEVHKSCEPLKTNIALTKVLITTHPFQRLCINAQERGWILVRPAWITSGKCEIRNARLHNMCCSLYNTPICSSGLTERERNQLREFAAVHQFRLHSQLRPDCQLLIISDAYYTSASLTHNAEVDAKQTIDANTSALKCTSNIVTHDTIQSIRQMHYCISTIEQVSLKLSVPLPLEQTAHEDTNASCIVFEEEQQWMENITSKCAIERTWEQESIYTLSNLSSKITFALRRSIPIMSFSDFVKYFVHTSVTHAKVDEMPHMSEEHICLSNANTLRALSKIEMPTSPIAGMEQLYCYVSPPSMCTSTLVHFMQRCGIHVISSLSTVLCLPSSYTNKKDGNSNIGENDDNNDVNHHHHHKDHNDCYHAIHIIVLTEMLREIIYPHSNLYFVRLSWLLSSCCANKLLPLTEAFIAQVTLRPVLTFTGISSHEKHMWCSALHNTIQQPFLVQDAFILGLPRSLEQEARNNMENVPCHIHNNVNANTFNADLDENNNVAGEKFLHKELNAALTNTTHLIVPAHQLTTSRKVNALANRVRYLENKNEHNMSASYTSHHNIGLYSEECVLVDLEWVKCVLKAKKWIDWTPYLLTVPTTMSLQREPILRQVSQVTNNICDKSIKDKTVIVDQLYHESVVTKVCNGQHNIEKNQARERTRWANTIHGNDNMLVIRNEPKYYKHVEEMEQQERKSYKRDRTECTESALNKYNDSNGDNNNYHTQVCCTLEKLLDNLEESLEHNTSTALASLHNTDLNYHEENNYECNVNNNNNYYNITNSNKPNELTSTASTKDSNRSTIAHSDKTVFIPFTSVKSNKKIYNTATLPVALHNNHELGNLSIYTTRKPHNMFTSFNLEVAEAAVQKKRSEHWSNGESQVVYYHREADNDNENNVDIDINSIAHVDAATPSPTSQNTLSQQEKELEHVNGITDSNANEVHIFTPSTCLLEVYDKSTLLVKEPPAAVEEESESEQRQKNMVELVNTNTKSTTIERAIVTVANTESSVSCTAFIKTPTHLRKSEHKINRLHDCSTPLEPSRALENSSRLIRLLIASDVKREWSNKEIELCLGSKCIFVEEAVACTHFVVAKPTKTEAFLCCLAAKKYILRPSFLESCIREGHLVSVEEHMWNINYAQKLRLRPSLINLITGMERQLSTPALPFANWAVYLCCTTPERSKSFHRILISGGCTHVCATTPAILCKTSKSLEQELWHQNEEQKEFLKQFHAGIGQPHFNDNNSNNINGNSINTEHIFNDEFNNQRQDKFNDKYKLVLSDTNVWSNAELQEFDNNVHTCDWSVVRIDYMVHWLCNKQDKFAEFVIKSSVQEKPTGM